ncbi:M28 family peptidase [Bacteroidota bacterium]
MKFKTSLSILFYFILASLESLSQINNTKFLDQITIESIKLHVDTLASETMEGRNTGEPGQKLAAQYISGQFANYGLKPFNPDSRNPYYQKFDLKKFDIGESIIFYNNLTYKTPIYVANKSKSDSISSEILYTGYANEKDLSGLELSNKSIFFLSESVSDAIKKAKGISNSYQINTFIIGLPFGKRVDQSIFKNSIKDLYSFIEFFYYYYYIALKQRTESDFNKLVDHNKMIPNFKIDSEKDINILFVPEKLAEGLFLEDFNKLEKLAKSNKKSKINNLLTIESSDFSYKVIYDPKIEILNTENIIGFIDSPSDENIIIGAHYDHVGRNFKNEINYGADDNASGTTAILKMAELFSLADRDGVKFNTDIIFIAFSAEELGLLGSQYYVQKPFFSLEKTNVMFNIDMIGRDMDDDPNNSNRVFLLKWKGGSKYIKKVNKINKEHTNLTVDKTPGIKNRVIWSFGSDHRSYVKEDVSCVAYFTALHSDYHTPGDTPDKINYNKMNRIIKLLFLNVWGLTTE